MVLCAANHYEQKYYLSPEFESLPEEIKKELQLTCVLFVEEVGGIFIMEFDEDGNLLLDTQADKEDILYDDIGAGLKIKELQKKKVDFFEQLELYYKVFCTDEDPMKYADLIKDTNFDEEDAEELARAELEAFFENLDELDL